MDIHHHLALNVDVDVENQPVDGGAHRALDGVLNRNKTQVNRPIGHRFEYRGDGSHRAEFSPSQVSLGQQRLVGERGGRPEIGDRGRRRVHTRAG